tara:strand:- start:63 stop:305 length:243 start_codon:yes stop_codon:yes gene_type:complete
MENAKEFIIEECLNVLKRNDVKKEIKNICYPVVEMILEEIYPYIYISLTFVIISFLLILSNFILLIIKNNKNNISQLKLI